MKSRLENWIQNQEFAGSHFQIEHLDTGESNETFQVKDENRNLIVKTSKEDSEDRISHERDVLQFLEQHNIENVPKVIYYEEDSLLDRPILIESSVGREKLNVEDATTNQTDKLAELMAEIHSINVEDYNDFFGTNHSSTVTLEEELVNDFERYSKAPYEDYRSMAEEVNQKVEQLYNRQKELIEEASELDLEVPWTFVHGDIPNNLRQEDDEIYIVDWELAGVGVPYIELIEFFTSGRVSDEKQEAIIEEYEKKYKLPEDWRESAELIEKFHGFNSMIWAAKKKEQRDNPKYNKIFEERLEQVGEMW